MLKIGFSICEEAEDTNAKSLTPICTDAPVKSLVQVFFPERGLTQAYYNELFCLREGDIVFVDGKLEGLRGRVVSVKRHFKIRQADYQKVIGKADTHVYGKFAISGSHMVTDDAMAIPFEKVVSWYKPPVGNENYLIGDGYDNESFNLMKPENLPFAHEIAERGANYYRENRVIYIEYENGVIRGLVSGEKIYTVEFTLRDGEIGNMLCECPCAYPCKHLFAAALQVKELVETPEIKKMIDGGHFSAISKNEFFNIVLADKNSGWLKVDT